MVPVGGIYTIDSEKARRMMAQIEPKVIIPMHYRDGEAGVQELGSGGGVYSAFIRQKWCTICLIISGIPNRSPYRAWWYLMPGRFGGFFVVLFLKK